MIQRIYNMQLINDCKYIEDKSYDFFLLAPNIEKRSRKFFVSYKNIDGLFKKIIIMDYPNFHKKIDEKQEETFYDDFTGLAYSSIQEENDVKMIREICKLGINSGHKICIDITGFSIPNIYQIMGFLKNTAKVKQLDVIYTEPKFYVYEEGYFDSYHMKSLKSMEQRKCAPVTGYFNAGENEQEILTIFLGFDGGLADLVYFKLGEEGKEILQTVVVNGFPSYTTKLKDISLYNNEDIINKIGKDNLYNATANNPFETYNLLRMLLDKYKGTLLNLCTIGSKPMALGTCLFALDHKDEVKVTYPFYEKKTFDAEEQAGKIWRYSIEW